MSTIINATTTNGVVIQPDNSGSLQLATNNGTTAVTVDASQNVGIGTTSPTVKLSIVTAATNNGLNVNDGTVNTILFNTLSSTGSLGTTTNHAMAFYSNNSERMRIDPGGNVLVGTTSQISSAKVSISGGGGGGGLAPLAMVNPSQATRTWNCGPDVNGNFVVTTVAGTNGQFISYGATSWTSTSDERLKTTLVPFENAVSKIVTLRAGTGRYLKDEESVSRSFLLAQDVQKVLPEAVNVQNDEIGTLGLQYTDLIPLLVAAIQEQQTIIQDLKARIETLEAK